MTKFDKTALFGFCFVSHFLLLVNTSLANDIACELEFTVTAEIAHGTIAVGDQLTGKASFQVTSTKRNEDAISYMSEGELSVADVNGGKVSGNIWIVNVARTPSFTDFISIDVKEVKGDLGGVESYFDPMLVTLYTEGGAMTSHDLPSDAQGWNALSKNRTFQVHTHSAQETFYGKPGDFSGGCTVS